MSFKDGRLPSVWVLVIILLNCAHFVRPNAMLTPGHRGLVWAKKNHVTTNYNYMEIKCGGIGALKRNQGECGLCGDAFDRPRHHEKGGKYSTGGLAKTYWHDEKTIKVKILLNSDLGGYFIFHLCEANGKLETQACFDKNFLMVTEGRWQGDEYAYIVQKAGVVHLTLEIPQGISCNRCVLQWKYMTANTWGRDLDGSGCIGCGIQEQYVNCADIRIMGWGNTTRAPPTTTTTLPPPPPPRTTQAVKTAPPPRPPKNYAFTTRTTRKSVTDRDEGARRNGNGDNGRANRIPIPPRSRPYTKPSAVTAAVRPIIPRPQRGAKKRTTALPATKTSPPPKPIPFGPNKIPRPPPSPSAIPANSSFLNSLINSDRVSMPLADMSKAKPGNSGGVVPFKFPGFNPFLATNQTIKTENKPKKINDTGITKPLLPAANKISTKVSNNSINTAAAKPVAQQNATQVKPDQQTSSQQKPNVKKTFNILNEYTMDSAVNPSYDKRMDVLKNTPVRAPPPNPVPLKNTANIQSEYQLQTGQQSQASGTLQNPGRPIYRQVQRGGYSQAPPHTPRYNISPFDNPSIGPTSPKTPRANNQGRFNTRQNTFVQPVENIQVAVGQSQKRFGEFISPMNKRVYTVDRYQNYQNIPNNVQPTGMTKTTTPKKIQPVTYRPTISPFQRIRQRENRNKQRINTGPVFKRPLITERFTNFQVGGSNKPVAQVPKPLQNQQPDPPFFTGSYGFEQLPVQIPNSASLSNVNQGQPLYQNMQNPQQNGQRIYQTPQPQHSGQQVYQAPPPPQTGQRAYQAPMPQQNGQNIYQAPAPPQNGQQTYQAPPVQQNGQQPYQAPPLPPNGQQPYQAPPLSPNGQQPYQAPPVQQNGQQSYQAPRLPPKGQQPYQPPPLPPNGQQPYQAPLLQPNGQQPYQAPPPQQNGQQHYQAPPPQQNGQQPYQAPPPQQNGQQPYQSPSSQQTGQQPYQAHPPQQNGQYAYQPVPPQQQSGQPVYQQAPQPQQNLQYAYQTPPPQQIGQQPYQQVPLPRPTEQPTYQQLQISPQNGQQAYQKDQTWQQSFQPVQKPQQNGQQPYQPGQPLQSNAQQFYQQVQQPQQNVPYQTVQPPQQNAQQTYLQIQPVQQNAPQFYQQPLQQSQQVPYQQSLQKNGIPPYQSLQTQQTEQMLLQQVKPLQTNEQPIKAQILFKTGQESFQNNQQSTQQISNIKSLLTSGSSQSLKPGQQNNKTNKQKTKGKSATNKNPKQNSLNQNPMKDADPAVNFSKKDQMNLAKLRAFKMFLLQQKKKKAFALKQKKKIATNKQISKNNVKMSGKMNENGLKQNTNAKQTQIKDSSLNANKIQNPHELKSYTSTKPIYVDTFKLHAGPLGTLSTSQIPKAPTKYSPKTQPTTPMFKINMYKNNVTPKPTIKPLPVKPQSIKPPSVKRPSVNPQSIKPTSVKRPSFKPPTIKHPIYKPEPVKPQSIKQPTIKPLPIKQPTIKPLPIKQQTIKPPLIKPPTFKPSPTAPVATPNSLILEMRKRMLAKIQRANNGFTDKPGNEDFFINEFRKRLMNNNQLTSKKSTLINSKEILQAFKNSEPNYIQVDRNINVLKPNVNTKITNNNMPGGSSMIDNNIRKPSNTGTGSDPGFYSTVVYEPKVKIYYSTPPAQSLNSNKGFTTQTADKPYLQTPIKESTTKSTIQVQHAANGAQGEPANPPSKFVKNTVQSFVNDLTRQMDEQIRLNRAKGTVRSLPMSKQGMMNVLRKMAINALNQKKAANAAASQAVPKLAPPVTMLSEVTVKNIRHKQRLNPGFQSNVNWNSQAGTNNRVAFQAPPNTAAPPPPPRRPTYLGRIGLDEGPPHTQRPPPNNGQPPPFFSHGGLFQQFPQGGQVSGSQQSRFINW